MTTVVTQQNNTTKIAPSPLSRITKIDVFISGDDAVRTVGGGGKEGGGAGDGGGKEGGEWGRQDWQTKKDIKQKLFTFE